MTHRVSKPGISPLILPQATREDGMDPLELEDSLLQLPTFGTNLPRSNTMGSAASVAPKSPRAPPSVARLSQRRGSRASSWIDHTALSRFVSRGSNASWLSNEKSHKVVQITRPPRVNYYDSIDGAATFSALSEVPYERIERASSDDGCTFWLDITSPTSAELDDIYTKFKLHPITLENIQSSQSVERWEHYDNYFYMSLLVPSDELTVGTLRKDMRVIGMPVHLIIFPTGIISIQLDWVRYQDKVLSRINLIKSHLTIHSGWIAYAILDEVVDELTDILKYLEEKVDSIEDSMFISNDDPVDKKHDFTVDYQQQLKVLGVVKYQVFGLSKLTHAKAEICRGLIKKVTNQRRKWEGIHLYLGDVEDHAISLNHGIGHLETILRNLHNNYTAHMSLMVMQQDQKSLSGSLRLTYFGALVSIGLTVSGTWGMRCLVPGQPPSGESWPLDWFFSIVGITLCISLILAYIANRFATKALESEEYPQLEADKRKNTDLPFKGLGELQRMGTALSDWFPKKIRK